MTGILLALGLFAAIYEKLSKIECCNANPIGGKVRTQPDERITISNIRRALKTDLISVEPINVVPLHMSAKNRVTSMDSVAVRMEIAEKNAYCCKTLKKLLQRCLPQFIP